MTKEKFLTWARVAYPEHRYQSVEALMELVDTVDEYKILVELMKQTILEVEYNEVDY